MTHHTRRRVLAGVGTLALGSAVAGCTGDGGDDGGGNTVDMTGSLVFEPADITVAVGETVTWENVGGGTHTVTAYEDDIPDGAEYFASGGFASEQAARDGYPDSGGIDDGETYVHEFGTAGTYEYFCIPHESSGMRGSVTVEDG